ncbi:MAG: hypothetical protein RIQ59_378 [Bacteroidota bacterium]|jgi:hypothetical protein
MMTERDTLLSKIKIEKLGEINATSSSEEQFQNCSLRPILKLQNDLLLQFFITYAIKNKKMFFNLSQENKFKYIENSVQSDTVFRNQLIGLIIGLFSISEYQEYAKNPSNLNKRILNLLIERWKSQLHLLENNLF